MSKWTKSSDPKYGVWWEADCHLKSAQWYNNRWTEFLTESPRGKEEILDFGRHMMSQYGIKINY